MIFRFALAERLHMTVGELEARMTQRELRQWQAFDRFRAAQVERAAK